MHAVEELLRSRSTAEQIVEKFGPAVILERQSGTRSLSDRLAWLNDYNLNPLRVYSLRDKAVYSLQQNLGTTAGKKSNVISVSYRAKDPRLAHDVLTALLGVVREQYLKVNRTTGSQAFFEVQLDTLRSQLASDEQRLRVFKDQHHLVSLTSQRDSQVALLSSLEADLLRTKAEESSVAAEVEVRRSQLHGQPNLIVTEQTTGQPQTAKQTLREKLYELEIQEQELAARLKDDAPQLIQIRKQIVEARRIAVNEQVELETKRAISQTHQAAELALQEREAQLVALRAKSASLAEKIAAGREALKKLNAAEMELTRLERELELARANYRKYSENLEQARIDEELEAAKISSLNVMQPPSLTATPVTPQPVPTLALGLATSFLAAVAFALLTDRRHEPPATSMPPLAAVAIREPPPPTVSVRSRRAEPVAARSR
jgi:uncharacterized protein involved in exopolysaccharide biosynthesis